MQKLIPKPIPNRRGGTTLTEVLMSLLCMGIGVVAVASLFPIALLRSVQATQLTSGTILRFNAETLVDLLDEYDSTLPYNPANNRNLVFNPDIGVPSGAGVDADSGFQQHFNQTYLVDPLGAMVVRQEKGLNILYPDLVGNMKRFDGLGVINQGRNENNAAQMVTLPDSWVTMFDLDTEASTLTSVTIPSGSTMDYQQVLDTITSGSGQVRLVLFSQDTNLSEVRILDDEDNDGNIGTNDNDDVDQSSRTITWTGALPNTGKYASVPRVRIEVSERRYTWMLTVRNRSRVINTTATNANYNLTANVDVVIFFRRTPSTEEEQSFALTAVAGQPRKYQLPSLPPSLKKGGFMLDTNFGKWHRIQAIDETNFIITLERSTSGSLDGNLAVFPRGVIDVYPLGQKTP